MKPFTHKCIVCSKEIDRIHGFDNDKIWEGCWNDGIVENISAGYGSKLDGDQFTIAICDRCILDKQKENVIFYTGNYMFVDSDITNETYDIQID